MKRFSLLTCLLFVTALRADDSIDSARQAERGPASYRPAPAPNQPSAPSSAGATTNAEANPSEGAKDFGLSGDWGGRRSRLDNKGLNFAALYKGEYSRVFSGGADRDSSFLENLDLRLLVDAEKLAGWHGLTFFVYGLGDWTTTGNSRPSRNVGDVQGTSNIETSVNAFKLYQAWVQKAFAEGRASALLGIHDLNSEFYVTDTSGLFFNASFGVGKELAQTGVSGPSIFPNTTEAVRLRVNPTDRYYLQTAVFNAVSGNPDAPYEYHHAFSPSDGFLYITEAAYVGPEEHPAKYGVGVWSYSRTFDHTTETVTNSSGAEEPRQVTSSGVYVLVDQSITHKLSAFARFGVASANSNEVKNNLSSGVVIKGLFGGRAEDKLGLAFTQVQPTQDQDTAQETSYEITYRMQFGRGIALQPDFQYVQNPSFSKQNENALVGTVRVEIGL